jgi:F-type H+-transporting ATPase subunit b
LNFDVFETNILNLSVVIGLVVTVVGEAASTTLAQRKQKIQIMLQRVDKEVDAARIDLISAKKRVDKANVRSNTIKTIGEKIVYEAEIQENKQLRNEISLLRKKTERSIQSDQYQELKAAGKDVLGTRFAKVNHTLLETFDTNATHGSSRYAIHLKVNQIFTRREFVCIINESNK